MKTTFCKPDRFDRNDIQWLCPSLTDQPFDQLKALGMASWLWAQSPLHQTWPSWLLGSMVWPAIVNRQFLMARNSQHQPLAYVSWARFDAEREKKYLANPTGLDPEDWDSGDRLWFIDWVSPFGGARVIAKKMETEMFTTDVGHALRVKHNSTRGKILDDAGIAAELSQRQASVDSLKQSLTAAFGGRAQ